MIHSKVSGSPLRTFLPAFLNIVGELTMSDDAPQAASRNIRILVGDKSATLHLKDGEIRSSSTSRTCILTYRTRLAHSIHAFTSLERPPFPITPAYHVLLAEVKDDILTLSYIKRRGKGKQSMLTHEHWKVEDRLGAQEWCAAVMVSAYNGTSSAQYLPETNNSATPRRQA